MDTLLSNKDNNSGINYKKRLFLYFFIVFLLFSVTVLVFQGYRDRLNRIEMMSNSLRAYTYALDTTINFKEELLDDVRFTSISESGIVVLDSYVDREDTMENHLMRPEVIEAHRTGDGYHIRRSATTGEQYFYYARKVDDGFIRVALPYHEDTKAQLGPDIDFIIIVIILFLVALVALWLIAKRFGRDLEAMKCDLMQEVTARAKLKAEMTSAIAHELRTPTSAIRSYSETLCDEGIEPEYKAHFIKRIHAASLRLSELLENVSLLTKMEEAPSRFTVQDVDVAEIAREVGDEFLSMNLAGKSLSVECDIPLGVVVQGSRALIYSIWRNLLENAIKYGRNNVEVKMQMVKQEGGLYHFCLSDNGVGLEAKHLPRLFERFYRVEAGRTRDDGGSGLGLSIVAHAVQNHGGTVSARIGDNGGLAIDFSLAIDKVRGGH